LPIAEFTTHAGGGLPFRWSHEPLYGDDKRWNCRMRYGPTMDKVRKGEWECLVGIPRILQKLQA